MVGNFVSGTVNRNFLPYNRRYTSPNEHFEYGYPHSNAFFNIYSSKARHFASNWSFVSNVKQLRQPIISDVTYDVGAPTVYRRIYWRKFLTLSNQRSRYIRKCIRIHLNIQLCIMTSLHRLIWIIYSWWCAKILKFYFFVNSITLWEAHKNRNYTLHSGFKRARQTVHYFFCILIYM